MTTDEKIAKLNELVRQAWALESAIRESGLGESLIRGALDNAYEVGIELGASVIILTKSQKAVSVTESA